MSNFMTKLPKELQGSKGVTEVLNRFCHSGRNDWTHELSPRTNNQLRFLAGGMSLDWNLAVQKAMYLLDPPPVLKTLPGAETFFEFLKKCFANKDIVIEPAIVLDVSYDMDYCKCYYLQINGECFGTYKTFGPVNDESDFAREYSGFIPGYVNKLAETHNEYQFMDIPVCKVSLIWGNKSLKHRNNFEDGDLRDWRPQLINTNWRRQDGHSEIPFP